MNKRRARKRGGHPRLGVQRRAARQVRGCGGRSGRRGEGGGVVGTGEDRVRCDGRRGREEGGGERGAGFGSDRRGSEFDGDPATLSSVHVQRRNIR